MKNAAGAVLGELFWSYESGGLRAGFTSANYLRDGTQDRKIGALLEALAEARGQLGRLPLEVVNAVPKVGPPAAKIDCHVPIAAAWNRDAGR